MGFILDRKKSSAFRRIDTLQKRLKDTHRKSWTYGVHEESGQHESGYSYAALATLHHNGYSKNGLPPRPWLTLAYAWNRKKYDRLIKKALRNFLLSNKKNPKLEDYIAQIASIQVKDAKAIFGNGSFLLPNAPETVRKKGKNSPLIDTGSLRDHVGFKLSWSGSVQYS